MSRSILFILVFLFSSFFGEVNASYKYKPYFPKRAITSQQDTPSAELSEEVQEEKTHDEDAQKVLIQQVKGVFLISEEGKGDIEISAVRGVEEHCALDLLSASDKQKIDKYLNRLLINKTLTWEKLHDVQAFISRIFKCRGYPFVRVYIPEQDITDQVVTIAIVTSAIGEVTLTGNKHFKDQCYLRCMCLCPGDKLNTKILDQSLWCMNNSPFRCAQLIFTPGEKENTTDIEIIAKDRFPFRVYAGVDNTGFKVTDLTRLFFGFNWGNVCNCDATLAYQYTASPDFKKFQGHMVNFKSPLCGPSFLELFGGMSLIEVKDPSFLPADVCQGKSYQVSGRYGLPICPTECFSQIAKIGLDYKRTNNDLVVGETTIMRMLATVFQIAASYDVVIKSDWGAAEFGAELFVQPGGFSSSMNQAAYDRLRPGAETKYAYGRFLAHTNICLPCEFLLDMRFRAQASSGALLPLEQFGLGGVNSVRGYVDRAVNVDNGLIFNLESVTPGCSIINCLKNCGKKGDCLVGLAFVDIAYGTLDKTVPGQDSSYFLAGVGPGIRYSVGEWLNARLDWGFKLNKIQGDENPISRIYFSIVASY